MTVEELKKNIKKHFKTTKNFCEEAGISEQGLAHIISTGKLSKKQINNFSWVFYKKNVQDNKVLTQ